MNEVFLAALVAGVVATALFAVLGAASGAGHGHVHVGHGAHAHTGHAHAHAGSTHGGQPHAGQSHSGDTAPHSGTAPSWLANSSGWALSWLSPLTLAAAALWFGAAGLLAEGRLPALLVAIVAAVIGAFIVRALMNAFVRSNTEPLQLTGEGALATVNATIRPGVPGEVVYTLEGLYRSMPARCDEGVTIPRGSTVVITRRSGGFAWVEPVDPLDNISQLPS